MADNQGNKRTEGPATTAQDDDDSISLIIYGTIDAEMNSPMASQNSTSDDAKSVQSMGAESSHQQSSGSSSPDNRYETILGCPNMTPEGPAPQVNQISFKDDRIQDATKSISDPSREYNPSEAPGDMMAANIPELRTQRSSSKLESRGTKEVIKVPHTKKKGKKRNRRRLGCENCVTGKYKCSAVVDKKFPCQQCIKDKCEELCDGPYDPRKHTFFNPRLERKGTGKRLRDTSLSMEGHRCRKIRKGKRCIRPFKHGGNCKYSG